MGFEQFVLAHEPAIRLGFFVGVFALVALWELAAPRRALTVSKALRWGSNLGLVALNTVLLRLMLPLAAVGVAQGAVFPVAPMPCGVVYHRFGQPVVRLGGCNGACANEKGRTFVRPLPGQRIGVISPWVCAHR